MINLLTEQEAPEKILLNCNNINIDDLVNKIDKRTVEKISQELKEKFNE